MVEFFFIQCQCLQVIVMPCVYIIPYEYIDFYKKGSMQQKFHSSEVLKTVTFVLLFLES